MDLGLKPSFESVAASYLRHAMLMRIAHYPRHSRERGDLLRRALGIAARYHDSCIWVFAMDTANGGASVLVCGGGDRASIQDDNISVAGRVGL